MRFLPEFIERLRNAVSISEVIGKRIAIKRHGREFQALCPFHKEQTPSFTINDDKGFYHCFGCKASGDVIGFIKDYENINYVEAVEKLAGELGILIPQMTQAAQASYKKITDLEEVLTKVTYWFTKQLNSTKGKEARIYLENRGIKQNIIEQFQIGFSPNSRDELKNDFAKQGINENELIRAGLLAKSDDNTTYDRFRGRLIFPIRNSRGKVIAFGGRILPSANNQNSSNRTLAKYINSPETELYKKGEVLFGLDVAKRNAHEKNIIVAEGYLDVIALHQAGFTTAVAPLGTAITEMQLKLLWQYSKAPIICLDGDEAGKRAMAKAATIALPLLNSNNSLQFVALPLGEDPDSIIKKSGIAIMHQYIDNAKIFSQVIWENALQNFGSKTAEQKAALDNYLSKTSDVITDNILKSHIKSYFRDQIFSLRKKFTNNKKPLNQNIKPSPIPEIDDYKAHIKPIEEALITHVITDPQILHKEGYAELLANIDFTQPLLDKLRFSVLEIASFDENIEKNTLLGQLHEQGFSETIDYLLNNNSDLLNSDLLKNSFEEIYKIYENKKFAAEFRQAELQLANDMSEENFNRFLALKQQLLQSNNQKLTN
jgi:DNA primase